MNENLLMEVVRMLREREDYYDKEWIKAEDAGQATSGAMLLGKSSAYCSARQMLLAALTDDVGLLREFDYFRKEEE